jgi:hypothetical protein
VVNLWLMGKKGNGNNLALEQNPQLAEASATFLQHSQPTSGIDPCECWRPRTNFGI